MTLDIFSKAHQRRSSRLSLLTVVQAMRYELHGHYFDGDENVEKVLMETTSITSPQTPRRCT
jgi:hypothetical protein